MRKKLNGSVTVFLALSMTGFLMLCLTLAEGTRVYFMKVQSASAMDLAEFSVLSEYQNELLEKYGVFFLDLDYEQGKEHTGILEQRAEKYLQSNTTEIETVTVCADNFRRATDGKGTPFFNQAVAYQKVKSGYIVFEELLEVADGFGEDVPDLGELLEQNEDAAGSILGESEDDQMKVLWDISLPGISFPSMEILTGMVLGTTDDLSQKSVDIGQRIENRTLEKGIGKQESIGIVDMQLFHSYLFDHFTCYGEQKGEKSSEALEYQLEYIISGQGKDRDNLEDIMWRIFLLRAGGNYLFYHQDSGKAAVVQAEAAAIASLLANPELTGLIEEILYIVYAIEDGISETKQIFAGEKVPLYENGIFSGLELGYKEYLFLFLNITGSTDKIYRCMDLIEMEVRNSSGYEEFRMDHCTDHFQLQWTYQFHSLFRSVPTMNGGTYENTMKGIFQYEI